MGRADDLCAGGTPYLLLATADERAHETMPPAAAALGLDPRPGAFTTRVTGATARIGDDGWVYLDDKAGQLVACRPTAAEWAELARRDRRVVLAIGYAPMPTGMRIDTYTDQLLKSGQLALGLVALA